MCVEVFTRLGVFRVFTCVGVKRWTCLNVFKQKNVVFLRSLFELLLGLVLSSETILFDPRKLDFVLFLQYIWKSHVFTLIPVLNLFWTQKLLQNSHKVSPKPVPKPVQTGSQR